MNDELITRLREIHGQPSIQWTADEAADALEAAQRKLNTTAEALAEALAELDDVGRLSHRFRSERDAEAAHADALDEALAEVAMFDGNHERRYRIIKAARAALRERHTKEAS